MAVVVFIKRLVAAMADLEAFEEKQMHLRSEDLQALQEKKNDEKCLKLKKSDSGESEKCSKCGGVCPLADQPAGSAEPARSLGPGAENTPPTKIRNIQGIPAPVQ